jgi:hypothetical protein
MIAKFACAGSEEACELLDLNHSSKAKILVSLEVRSDLNFGIGTLG